MAAGFLVLLVLAWVAICVPAATRARERSPLASTLLFKRGLELLGPDHHGSFVQEFGQVPSGSRSQRMAVRWTPTVLLCFLCAGVLGTGLAAVLRGGDMWEVHLATDAALALFVSLLLEEKHRKMERARKVRHLRARRQIDTDEVRELPLVVGGFE